MGETSTKEKGSKKDSSSKKLGEKSSKKSRKDGSSKKSAPAELSLEDQAAALFNTDDDAMVVDEPAEEPKKSKKSKKRRLEEDEPIAAPDAPADPATAEASDAPKKKKKKSKADTEAAESNAMVVDVPGAAPHANLGEEPSSSTRKLDIKEEKKAKKEKKKKVETPTVDLPSVLDSEPTPAAASEDAPPSTQPSEPLADKEKKKKEKKEKKEKKAKSATLEDDVPKDASPPKKKKSKSKVPSSDTAPQSPNESKSRKNHTEFPNPEGDESLDPQACKALEYAFTHVNNPSEWKFNKARQNWLLRNVWSNEMIPDIYLPLATKYITGIQGGSLTKLKEACTAALTEPEPAPEADAETDAPTADAEPSTDSLSAKPKSILKPTPGQPVAGAIIAAPVPVPAEPKEPTVDIKKQRAQILLDALAAATS